MGTIDSSDKLRKLTNIHRMLSGRIGTPHEKWGDRRKLRKVKRTLAV